MEWAHAQLLSLFVLIACVSLAKAGGKLLGVVSPRQPISAPAVYLHVRCANLARVPPYGYLSMYRVMPTLAMSWMMDVASVVLAVFHSKMKQIFDCKQQQHMRCISCSS